MVVAYRVHPLTAWIARRMLSLDRISLVNLIGNAEIVPEFLQQAVGCEALVTAVRPLLDPTGPESRKQREALDLVRTRLGLPGAAQRVVALAEELLAA
jgi:lipid-A-disaccharide synthase